MQVIHSQMEKFSFERSVSNKQTSMNNLQTHGHYELYYLLSGERNYFIEDTLYHIECGSVVIIPPMVLHRTVGEKVGNIERILLDIPKNFVGTELFGECLENDKSFIFNVPKKRRAMFEKILADIETEWARNDKFSESLIRNYTEELLVMLIRLKNDNIQAFDVETELVISKAAKYIAENFDKPLGLEDVAAYVNMSKSYFCKFFRRKTGCGFADYLTGVRINEGAKLLENTELDITEIAMRCGYNDSAYFTAVFKKIKGVTPTRYRKGK